METIRQILQHEAESGNLENHKPTAESNTGSQYELLKNVFAKNMTLGNFIIDVHMMKHPLAMEKQRQLFSSQPGLFPFLMTVVLDSEHPLRKLNEYLIVNRLLDIGYPTVLATDIEVLNWAIQLDIALANFVDSTLMCASYAMKNRSINADKSQLLARLDPALFNPELFTTGLVKAPAPFYQLGVDMNYWVQKLDNVRIHGVVRPEQERFIVEVAKAHKFFLARKLAILKSIEPNAKFTVGMVNELIKVKEFPAMFIGYSVEGNPQDNTPHIGVDFKNLHPVICIYENCRQDLNCPFSSGDFEYFYIKTSTVEVGEPPIGAKRAVNFDAMQHAWEAKAQSQSYHLPAVFDPLTRDRRKKYKRRKGVTNQCNNYIWEDRYLRYVAKEFKRKNMQDVEMMEKHVNDTDDEDDGELNFQFNTPPTLFLPKLYLIL